MVPKASSPENAHLKKMKLEFKSLKLQNKTSDKDARKFRMHDFIYQSKKKNLLKYDDSSKMNQFAMPVPKGTVSLMLNTQKKNHSLGISNADRKTIGSKILRFFGFLRKKL
jgi:hypothetical protein